jgi:hypothetical protein
MRNRYFADPYTSALFSILIICILSLLYLRCAGADETNVELVLNAIAENNLVMQFQSEGIFTEKVVKFLTRGFTIQIEYKIELWRRRRFWFDSLEIQKIIGYKMEYERLGKRYVCLKYQKNESIVSKLDQQLGAIAKWITLPDPPLIVAPVKKLDQDSEYYYTIIVSVATMTAQDIEDLQKWLGEFEEEQEEPSGLTKTSFKIAADFISSRNHQEFSVRSKRFRLNKLPKISS